jgi:NAD(P)-dependent dehydrogenase (short-subunit alcohol dehydrogenase family)
MGQVEGKVAIVTGGASEIGAACAATLARKGAKVVVTDLDNARGQAVLAGLRLYRQLQPGDWDKVIGEVAHDLHGFAVG